MPLRLLCLLTLLGSFVSASALERWQGAVDISGIGGKAILPVGMRLVLPLDDEAKQLAQEAVERLETLLAVEPDLAEASIEPANAEYLAEQISAQSESLPGAEVIQANVSGRPMFATTDETIRAQVKTAFNQLRPAFLRADLENLHGKVRELADARLGRVLLGFKGASAGVELMGIAAGGREADMTGAQGLLQARADYEWLLATLEFLETFGEDPALNELPVTDTPQGAWDVFRIAKAPRLEFLVELTTIREFPLEAGGRFSAPARGTPVFEMPVYGIPFFFPHGLDSSPVDIRLQTVPY